MALQVWLPLNGNLDNQGLDDVTIVANNSSYQNDGKIGKCLRLGYTNSFTIPSMVGAKQMTIAYWCRVNTATETNWLDPIHFYSTDGNETYVSRHEFFSNCENTGFWYKGGAIYIYSSPIVIGEWNHFAFTFNYTTGEASFYLNGSLFQTKTDLDTTHYITGINFRLGENGLDVSENDVRIYDHALSPREVAEIAKGLVLHYPLNRDGFGNDNFYSATGIGPCGAGITSYTNDGYEHHSVWNKGGTARAQNLGFNGKTGPWTVSFDVKASVNCSISVDVCDKAYATSAYGNDLVANKWTHKSYTITTATNQYNTSGNYNGFVDFNLSGSAIVEGTTLDIKNLHVEEGTIETPFIPASGTTAYTAMGVNSTTVPDVSGYGNNGIRNGTFSWSGDTPRYGTSAVFSENQYIVEPNEIITTDSTIALWVKSSLNGNVHVLDARNNSGIGKQPIYQYTNGAIQAGGNVSYVTSNSGLLVANTWVHVVLVQNGDSLLIYKNGDLFQTISCANSPVIKPTLGARFSFTSKYTGQLSDVRIYATALSADAVKELYQTSASLANNGTLMAYEFNEV